LPIQLKRRLKELKDEMARGQNMLNEHDAKRQSMLNEHDAKRQSMMDSLLCISGAVLVLQEEYDDRPSADATKSEYSVIFIMSTGLWLTSSNQVVCRFRWI